MNILIFGANWYNRGDESAIRAMIDEFRMKIPNCNIKIHFNQPVEDIPYEDIEIIGDFRRPGGKNFLKKLLYKFAVLTGGKVKPVDYSEGFKEFCNAINWAEYAIYAPGGPCIGDYYGQYQIVDMMTMLRKGQVPYSIYAVSMGPFSKYLREIKKEFSSADNVCLREEISYNYFGGLKIDKDATVTLDSALQHPVDKEYYSQIYKKYSALDDFLCKYNKVVGITIAKLENHHLYKNTDIKERTRATFAKFIEYLEKKGYGVVFIPQLFGKDNDYEFMNSFSSENTFTVSDEYDCYFQQYLISKLYFVVGMRYHSNIFSAKMKTPFISISYEQKMIGFMKRVGLEQYCIKALDLNYEILLEKFNKEEYDYLDYKKYLEDNIEKFINMSSQTTDIIVKSLLKLYDR